jgi:tetratricopeptide (TPR) repeat protein
MYRKQGGELYKNNEFARALDSFDKALQFGCHDKDRPWPMRPQVLGNRAATLMMVHRYIEAADDCAEALRLDPSMVKLHTRRGRALLRLGHFPAADEAFQRVLETAPVGETGAGHGEERELEAAKADARSGMKALASARSSMKRLAQLENALDYTGVLMLVADLQLHCPACSLVHVSRCHALCKLQKWGEAKAAVEEFLSTMHASVLRLEAHPSAVHPAPLPDRLTWTEKVGKNIVSVDAEGVVQAMLCMGPRLAEVYAQCIKNVDATRNCAHDVMSRVKVVLDELASLLKAAAIRETPVGGKPASLAELLGPWVWVVGEVQRTKDLIDWKTIGDRQFRGSNHADAIASYGKAIKSDPSAVRWAAILFNNRAAAHMAVGQLAEAIADCHEALSRDADYARAYLRRARALALSKSYAAAVRDFRRYLSSEPTPADSAAVSQEMEGAMEQNRKQMRGDQQRNEWEQRTEEQRRAWSGGPSSPSRPNAYTRAQVPGGVGAGAGRVPGFGPTVGGRGNPRPAYGAGGYGASSSGAKSSSSWNSDEEEKFNTHRAQQQRYGRPAPKASSYTGYSFLDDSEDEEEPPHTYSRGGWGSQTHSGNGTASSSGAGGGRPGAQKTGGIGIAGDHYQTLVSVVVVADAYHSYHIHRYLASLTPIIPNHQPPPIINRHRPSLIITNLTTYHHPSPSPRPPPLTGSGIQRHREADQDRVPTARPQVPPRQEPRPHGRGNLQDHQRGLQHAGR